MCGNTFDLKSRTAKRFKKGRAENFPIARLKQQPWRSEVHSPRRDPTEARVPTRPRPTWGSTALRPAQRWGAAVVAPAAGVTRSPTAPFRPSRGRWEGEGPRPTALRMREVPGGSSRVTLSERWAAALIKSCRRPAHGAFKIWCC